jgi:FkbM family methyltransferase
MTDKRRCALPNNALQTVRSFRPRRWLFAKHRQNPIVQHLARQCEKTVRAYRNVDYQPERNGEFALLQRLASEQSVTRVFDVGANVGEWSLKAALIFPKAQIHAFEIIPSTSEQCFTNCQAEPRITTHAHGLADTDGQVMVTINDDSTRASMTTYTTGEPMAAPVRRGDALLHDVGWDGLDFLKIDVEGAEMNVLKGFSEALAKGSIRYIQFEYGRAHIAARVYLKDFYELLEPLGYKLGKIYPTYVDFKPYAYADEDFLGPNYLAVKV